MDGSRFFRFRKLREGHVNDVHSSDNVYSSAHTVLVGAWLMVVLLGQRIEYYHHHIALCLN